MPYDIIIGRDESDKKKFGDKGLTYIGKQFVKMGETSSLSNKMYMDVARSHIVMVAGKRGCLTGDTLVLTDKGYKEIKEFNQKEDKIFSFNKEKKEFELEEAELLKYPLIKENLLEIEFIDGRKIRLTKEHPLLAVNGDKLLSLLWMKASKLERGNQILSIKKSMNDLVPLSIKNIKEIAGTKEVYDLSVNKNHSFIANGIISHNSGKSYTLGAIAEELANLPQEVAVNIATVIFDTMGIFWTMKYSNSKEYELLKDWDLKAKKLPVKVFVPYGFFPDYEKRGLPVDEKFALSVSELTADDWLITFNLNFTDPTGIVIQRAIENLVEKNKSYDIDDIISAIEKQEGYGSGKDAAVNFFYGAKTWGIFAEKGMKETKSTDMIVGGGTAILDLSCYNSVGTFNVRALVIGLLCKKFFNERMFARKAEEIMAVQKGIDYLNYKGEREMPLVWLFLDEGHEMLPKTGKTAATDALIQILREGRQPGISLVLATQQPGQIHTDVMTQADIVISHRVTSKPDIEALNLIMQNYLLADVQSYMNSLPALKGSAIVLDDNSERIYPMRVRPRFTWHGGEAPTAIKIEKRL
jgi:hypothetical protein